MSLIKAVSAVFGRAHRNLVTPEMIGACAMQGYAISEARGYEFGIAITYCTEHHGVNVFLGADLKGEPASAIRSLRLLETRRQALATAGITDEPFPLIDMHSLTKTYRANVRTSTQSDLERLLRTLDTIGQLSTAPAGYSRN